jgi:hypothetical protein
MALVRARCVECDCRGCIDAFLEEARSLGGLPLGGEIVEVPESWLGNKCPHGNSGLRFSVVTDDTGDGAREIDPEDFCDFRAETRTRDSSMDSTKNIGYPVREHGPYGSHPMHDNYEDESNPDGSESY